MTEKRGNCPKLWQKVKVVYESAVLACNVPNTPGFLIDIKIPVLINQTNEIIFTYSLYIFTSIYLYAGII